MVKRAGDKPRGKSSRANKSKKKAARESPEPEVREDDVYEATLEDAEEDRLAGTRYDRVDNYEYELPSDFEDEEIDEDAAFNEEDEKLYGHLFAPKGTNSESDEDNNQEYSDDLLDSETDDDDNSEEQYNADDFSDPEDAEDDEQQHQKKGKRKKASSGVEENVESEEEDLGSEESEDGQDDEDLDDLANEIARGGDDEEEEDFAAADTKSRKRRRDVVHTEAYPESEFNLPLTGVEGELTLTDLIAGLDSSRGKLGSARKELERMQRKSAPVSIPLPGPVKARQERKAGYEEAKKDIEKWMPIVKANREAPTLRFTADTAAVPRTASTAALVAKHVPETAMEMEVAALLEAAGAHTSKAVTEAEEALALKELTVEEARERRNQLAKMRALLFYHEIKAKRLKKIKSKDYRRRVKKAEHRKGLGGDDDGLLIDEDALRKDQEDAEFERAKERLTLKHKNTSRFIRRALKRGQHVMDEGTKEAVNEQLRLGQEIRARVNRMGARDGSDSDDDTSASDDSDNEDAGGKNNNPKSGALLSSKARKVALDILQGKTQVEEGEQASGLFSLPFMKRALEKQRRQAEEEAQAVLNAADGVGSRKQQQAGGGGRMAFGASSEAQAALAAKVQRMEEAAARDDSDLESDEDEDAEAKAHRLQNRLHGNGQAVQTQQHTSHADDSDHHYVSTHKPTTATKRKAGGTSSEGPLAVELPVLEGVSRQKARISQQDHLFEKQTTSSGALHSKSNTVHGRVTIGPSSKRTTQSKDSDSAAHAFIKTRQFAGPKEGYVFQKGAHGVGYYLDIKSQPAASTPAKQQQKRRSIGGNKLSKLQDDSDDDDEMLMKPTSTGKNQNGNNDAAGAGLSQEELVRRAFAGDDVFAEFAADKAAEVDDELPKEEVAGALPGWGTWASQKKDPKWMVEAKEKAQKRRDTAAANRKDAKLQYVIVSEKWDRRAAKYRTPSVPYPFDSKETYERAMRQPLGQEFNTDAAFRNLTRPAVIKDAGVVIEPIRYSAGVAEHDAKAPKRAKKAAIVTIAGGMPKRQKTAKK